LIANAVWLYFRFLPSFRLIEEMLPERGIIVSYEMFRPWCLQSGMVKAGGRPTAHLDGLRLQSPRSESFKRSNNALLVFALRRRKHLIAPSSSFVRHVCPFCP